MPRPFLRAPFSSMPRPFLRAPSSEPPLPRPLLRPQPFLHPAPPGCLPGGGNPPPPPPGGQQPPPLLKFLATAAAAAAMCFLIYQRGPDLGQHMKVHWTAENGMAVLGRVLKMLKAVQTIFKFSIQGNTRLVFKAVYKASKEKSPGMIIKRFFIYLYLDKEWEENKKVEKREEDKKGQKREEDKSEPDSLK